MKLKGGISKQRYILEPQSFQFSLDKCKTIKPKYKLMFSQLLTILHMHLSDAIGATMEMLLVQRTAR